MRDNAVMSHFFDHIWNRLPASLQQKLRCDPNATLTASDLEDLERAGVPTVHMEGLELESDLEEPTVSPEFQEWIRNHA